MRGLTLGRPSGFCATRDTPPLGDFRLLGVVRLGDPRGRTDAKGAAVEDIVIVFVGLLVVVGVVLVFEPVVRPAWVQRVMDRMHERAECHQCQRRDGA